MEKKKKNDERESISSLTPIIQHAIWLPVVFSGLCSLCQAFFIPTACRGTSNGAIFHLLACARDEVLMLYAGLEVFFGSLLAVDIWYLSARIQRLWLRWSIRGLILAYLLYGRFVLLAIVAKIPVAPPFKP